MSGTFRLHIRASVLDSCSRPSGLRLRGYHPLPRAVPGDFDSTVRPCAGPTSSAHCCAEFGSLCSAFDRLYSRNHGCFLFRRLIRCFNSAGSRSSRSTGRSQYEVTFGHGRFSGCVRLADPFRSLLRPSSVSRTQPSTSWLTLRVLTPAIDPFLFPLLVSSTIKSLEARRITNIIAHSLSTTHVTVLFSSGSSATPEFIALSRSCWDGRVTAIDLSTQRSTSRIL